MITSDREHLRPKVDRKTRKAIDAMTAGLSKAIGEAGSKAAYWKARAEQHQRDLRECQRKNRLMLQAIKQGGIMPIYSRILREQKA